MAFCHTDPYIPGSFWSANASDYMADAPNLKFKGTFLFGNDPVPIEDAVRTSYLETIFNGKCLLFEFDLDLGIDRLDTQTLIHVYIGYFYLFVAQIP